MQNELQNKIILNKNALYNQGSISITTLEVKNLQVQSLFWSLKTIATLVNYTCKSFIKFDPSIAVIALELPTSIFHTGKGSFEFLITGIFPLFKTAEISVTGD